MENTSFGEILEAADRLSVEEQEALIDVLHRRMIDRRREEIIEDINQANLEFKTGKCQPVTPSRLMKEIAP